MYISLLQTLCFIITKWVTLPDILIRLRDASLCLVQLKLIVNPRGRTLNPRSHRNNEISRK